MSLLSTEPVIARAPDAGGMPSPADTPFDMLAYFSGGAEGTGLFHDRFGRLRLGFDVTMVGRWDGDLYRLAEDFRYDDGRVQKREWLIRREPAGGLSATAEDIIGTGQGFPAKDHIRWDYKMSVPVGKRVIVMRFDDRMYLRGDGTVLNVSTARKFGLVMGRLTATFRRRAN